MTTYNFFFASLLLNRLRSAGSWKKKESRSNHPINDKHRLQSSQRRVAPDIIAVNNMLSCFSFSNI